MKSLSRRYVRNALIALALLLVAGWLLPSFFSAERYRHRLEASLERALQRPVVFGAVSYRLIPRPGFSIENAMVREDPAFGFEPFARVDRIDCDLRWRSLFRSRLDCAHLYLDHPSLNFVKNSRGEWNVESLLGKSALASPSGAASGASYSPGALQLDADGARIDLKLGADKKPFAITELRARVNFDRRSGVLTFRLEGIPIRTDLSVPSPGPVQLEGQWTPGAGLEGPLEATLRTNAALVYNWIPLVSGRNPEVYGMMDAEVRVTGSLHLPKFEGRALVSQLHRWGELPPSDPMPGTLIFRGQFDRARGRAMIESLDAAFADSHIHLTGSIDKLPSSPELDLVVAVARSRLEDFVNLSRRFSASRSSGSSVSLSGRVDALVSIQGPWRQRSYRGYVGGRDVSLHAGSQSFSVTDLDVRVEERNARLAPFRVTLAPHVQLVVEGAIERPDVEAVPSRHRRGRAQGVAGGAPRYELLMTAQGAPLHNLIGFARDIGLLSAQGVDARGTASAAFTLSGSVWPASRPTINGHAELRAARLLVPGFTEPIELPRALVQVSGDHVTANPVVAVLGTSVFTGRFEHQGERKQPWEFDIRANALSVEQGSLWFDALGHRPPIPLLARLPGLSSFGEVRAAASSLFGAVSAHGRFASPVVSYRGLKLTDFKTAVAISGRVVRLDGATFRAGGGRGRGQAVVDLTNSPAGVSVDLAMMDCNFQALAAHLPPALGRVRGTYSGNGHFETRGLSRQEMTGNLQGKATVRLKSVYLGEFDPVQALAGQAGWGALEPGHRETSLRLPPVILQVQDHRVELGNTPFLISGAKLRVSGTYGSDGALELRVRADLSHLTRHWLNTVESDPNSRLLDVRLAGSFHRLAVQPQIAASQPAPMRRDR